MAEIEFLKELSPFGMVLVIIFVMVKYFWEWLKSRTPLDQKRLEVEAEDDKGKTDVQKMLIESLNKTNAQVSELVSEQIDMKKLHEQNATLAKQNADHSILLTETLQNSLQILQAASRGIESKIDASHAQTLAILETRFDALEMLANEIKKGVAQEAKGREAQTKVLRQNLNAVADSILVEVQRLKSDSQPVTLPEITESSTIPAKVNGETPQ